MDLSFYAFFQNNLNSLFSMFFYSLVTPQAVSTTCPNKGQIRFDITLPGSNAQYSAALAAMMAGKDIRAKITDVCINGYPTPEYFHAYP